MENLIEMSAAGRKTWTDCRQGLHVVNFMSMPKLHDMGIVTVEPGHHPRGNRFTLLVPDVAFVESLKARARAVPGEIRTADARLSS